MFVTTATWIVLRTLEGILLVVVATFMFDVIHYVLHRCMESRFAVLQAVGSLHRTHHEFLNESLRFNDALIGRNMVRHVIPEYLTRMVVCAFGFFVFSPVPVVVVMACFTLFFGYVVCKRGKDQAHTAFEHIPPATEIVLIGAPFHSLHHVFPENFYGSFSTLFDRLMGTGCQIRGRRIAITGASGALGGPMKRLLEAAGAEWVRPLKYGVDYTYDDYSRTDDILREAHILVLCHGTIGPDAMQANCQSFVALIERFKQVAGQRQVPPEVWAVGSEIEFHPAFGERFQEYARSKRAFAAHARWYFRDPAILYRHIVPAAFRSPIAWGLFSGTTTARVALWFIRRGFRYVPVTYTGIALANCPWFFLGPRAAADPCVTADF